MKAEGKKDTTILVVDDDEKLLGILKHIFEKEGFKVITATESLEGLRIARDEKVDLVILDIIMPAMDGYEMCRKLVEDDRTYSVPIVFLTAKDKPSDKLLGYFCGGSDYVTKPFKNADLVARVRTLLKM